MRLDRQERLDGREPLTVLPFLAGERAPGWRGDRRGAVTGLSLDTTALDIVHAALESVALRLALVYGLLAPLARGPLGANRTRQPCARKLPSSSKASSAS